MTYEDRNKQVRRLRELADFLENEGHKLPDSVWPTTTLYVSLTETDYKYDPETEQATTSINEAGTKENIRRFLEAVGACEKKYTDDRLTITKNNSDDRPMIVGTVDRQIMCKRVITGQKMVPAQLVDEYDYVCDENLSLLKLVK